MCMASINIILLRHTSPEGQRVGEDSSILDRKDRRVPAETFWSLLLRDREFRKHSQFAD